MARRQMKHVSCSLRHKSILKFRPYLQATHHSYVSRFFLDEYLQLLSITNVNIQINVLNKISRNLASNFLYEFAIFQQQQFGIRATFQNLTRTIKIGLVVFLDSPAPSLNDNDNNDNNNDNIQILRGDL